MERYSKVNFPELRKVKKEINGDINKARDRDNFLFREKYKALSAMEISEDGYYDLSFKREIDLLLTNYAICQHLKENEWPHHKAEIFNYYIDEKLFNFLSETPVKISDKDIREIYKGDIDKGENNVFYMWIHSKKFTNSILYQITIGGRNNIDPEDTFYSPIEIVFSNGHELYGHLSIHEYDKCKNIGLEDFSFAKILEKGEKNIYEEGLNAETFKHIKFILNLIFYMSAFPENVLNAPPDEECDKLNKDNSKTISISNTISEYLNENRDVQPHLRRGHFRFLGSDHFKKKRGQTVFVKASFIRGEAKTVI